MMERLIIRTFMKTCSEWVAAGVVFIIDNNNNNNTAARSVYNLASLNSLPIAYMCMCVTNEIYIKIMCGKVLYCYEWEH